MDGCAEAQLQGSLERGEERLREKLRHPREQLLEGEGRVLSSTASTHHEDTKNTKDAKKSEGMREVDGSQFSIAVNIAISGRSPNTPSSPLVFPDLLRATSCSSCLRGGWRL